jgi:hypothetical protein
LAGLGEGSIENGECRISHWCECGSFQQFPRLAKYRQVGDIYALSDAKVKLFPSGVTEAPQYIGTAFWRHVLQESSNRRLTKFSDSLPTLSAIAERIQNVTGDTYCAGLWKSTLEDDLCWYNHPSTPKYSIIWDSSSNVPKGRNEKGIPSSIFYPNVVPFTPAWACINGNMKATFCRRNTTNILQSDRKKHCILPTHERIFRDPFY